MTLSRPSLRENRNSGRSCASRAGKTSTIVEVFKLSINRDPSINWYAARWAETPLLGAIVRERNTSIAIKPAIADCPECSPHDEGISLPRADGSLGLRPDLTLGRRQRRGGPHRRTLDKQWCRLSHKGPPCIVQKTSSRRSAPHPGDGRRHSVVIDSHLSLLRWGKTQRVARVPIP